MVNLDKTLLTFLIAGGLIMVLGLSYVFNLDPWLHREVPYTYTSNPIVIDDGILFVTLDFNATDAFVAQNSMDVAIHIDEPSFINESNIITPQKHPLSNELRHGSYYVIIIDAKNSDQRYPETISNYSGALVQPIHYSPKPVLHAEGNSKVIFPLAGDYTAYLIVDYESHPEVHIPLGRVMNVSPPEASLQLESNNIITGLSIIVVGLTLVQVGLALHRKKKDTPKELTNHSIIAPPQDAEKYVKFEIKLAKIGMVFGASAAVGITIAGVGIALIAEHENPPYMDNFLVLGIFLLLFGVFIILVVTLAGRRDLDSLEEKNSS